MKQVTEKTKQVEKNSNQVGDSCKRMRLSTKPSG